jgi:hypothetical protein
MQIALYMNYRKIYIIGCDMGSIDGKLYPWGSNPDVSDEKRMAGFQAEADNLDHAATLLDEPTRKRFVFCSEFNKWPFVDKYNRLPHSEAVDNILAESKNK